MEEHLSRVESLLIQVELQLYEIKKQLKLPATQEHILRHLKEKREAALARCHVVNAYTNQLILQTPKAKTKSVNHEDLPA